jgi:3-oxoacyl-[acyl-carrier-protein] synthase III
MADDLTKQGSSDRTRINMAEKQEVQYWTKTFGVTKEQLAAAIEKVGNTSAAVRLELRK